MGREMDDFQNDATNLTRPNFQMDTGTEVLAKWGETAGQAHKNAVYRSLFSMLEGSLLRTHNVVDDFQVPAEFFVILKEDLVLKLRLNGFHSFGVVYIGPWDGAPGVEARD